MYLSESFFEIGPPKEKWNKLFYCSGARLMTLVYILLPAYNEEENLPDLLSMIDNAISDYRVIVVNDGSQDRTGEVAREYSKKMPITVLDHDENMGLGCALRTGMLHIMDNCKDCEAVVTMDSDFTHDPQMVPLMVKELDNGSDVVIASRFVPGGDQRNLPLHRRMLSWGINRLIRMKGSTVRDSTSGFRCIRINALRSALEEFGADFINTKEFTATALILLRLQHVGVTTKEIPMILDYGVKRGPSKLKVVPAIRSYLRLLRKI